MNLGEIKAFLRDKPTQANPNQEANKQLRDIGLRQAAEGVRSYASLSVSSQTTVGIRVFSNSLSQSLAFNSTRPDFSPPEKKQQNLFDFEEVAKNVLRFVSGAITHAAAKGADQEELAGLFEQARSGVLKGIGMAEKDLEGFMNEEIEQGIANSKALIDEGIDRLERKLSGKEAEEPRVDALGIYESAAFSREDSGDLTIRTRDGDEVSIRFEDFQQFEYNRRALLEFGTTQPLDPIPEPPSEVKAAETQQTGGEQTPVAATTTEQTQADNEQSQAAPAQNAVPVANTAPQSTDDDDETEQANQQVGVSVEQNYQYFESSALSFSVKGELDEDELKAIGDLVSDASELADEFFNGDVESAFNQALEIGFDAKELTGFALNLSRTEKVEVVQAYEYVSHYNDEVSGGDNPAQAVKPVSQYLEKMLDVIEQSKQKLEDSSAYENMLNGIVNQVRDVQATDLISAINRIHSFNKMLLDNIPATPEQVTEG